MSITSRLNHKQQRVKQTMSNSEQTALDADESTPSTPAAIDYRKITRDGLWNNNAALVQLLGLCPLLAVSNSVVNALGLGLATIFVLVVSNCAVSLIRNQVNNEVRLPVFVLIIASATTCIELLMKAFTFELYEILGIFIPLIVTNCSVLGRADAFAAKNPIKASAVDGFMMGSGFLAVLVLLGAVRELLGQGTLFANMELLLGEWASILTITFVSDYRGFLFAILPPGAFVVMGFIIALKNLVDERQKRKLAERRTPTTSGSKRVRVTGVIS